MLTQLHMYARNLDPGLDKVRYKVQRLLEVRLGALRITDQESILLARASVYKTPGFQSSLEGAAHVVSLGLSLLRADPLLNRLSDKRDSMVIVGRSERIKRQREGLVAL